MKRPIHFPMRVTALIFALYATSGLAAANVDIVGIRTGMSPDEVRAAMKAHNPNLTIAQTQVSYNLPGNQHTPNFISGVVGSLPATQKNYGYREPDVVYAAFSGHPRTRAVFIWRQTTFPDNQSPNRETILAALREKYGPESGVREPGTVRESPVWLYSVDGQLIKLDKAALYGGRSVPCTEAVRYVLREHSGGESSPNPNPPFSGLQKEQIPPTCGKVIVSTIMLSPIRGGNTVRAINVLILDNPLLVQSLPETDAYVASESEKIKQKDIEQAKKVGAPKL